MLSARICFTAVPPKAAPARTNLLWNDSLGIPLFPASKIESSEMENQGVIGELPRINRICRRERSGFSGSSSYEGGQHKMLIVLTEPHLWNPESSPDCDPDEFSAIEDRSFPGLWLF